MTTTKFKVVNRELFEKVKNRPLEKKETTMLGEYPIVIAKSLKSDDVLLKVAKTEESYVFQVVWDDSVEEFKGFVIAFEEFQWCVEVNSKVA